MSASRFPSCLAAVGSTGGILKSACSHCLGVPVRSGFRVGVVGTSG